MKNEKMKNIILNLTEGKTLFECLWNGESNKCEILMINIETERVFVRFEKPVKTTATRYVKAPFSDEDVIERYDTESSEEWISL